MSDLANDYMYCTRADRSSCLGFIVSGVGKFSTSPWHGHTNLMNIFRRIVLTDYPCDICYAGAKHGPLDWESFSVEAKESSIYFGFGGVELRSKTTYSTKGRLSLQSSGLLQTI